MASETLADIMAGMRYGTVPKHQTDHELLALYADRIEAAAKRMEQTYLDQIRDAINQWGHEKYKAEHASVVNAAAMREALLKCREIASQWEADEAAGVAGTTDKPESRSAAEAVTDMEFEINAALAAPPRQCDVGTAEEQAERFEDYCEKRCCASDCDHRMYEDESKVGCTLIWAQMPYEPHEEGGAK